MKTKIESPKVFYDLLFDYKELVYIFEYGFFWDEQLSDVLDIKAIPKIRELYNALSENIYDRCAKIPWWLYTKDSNAKKSNRMLVHHNHYNIQHNQWFLEMYGCYGLSNQTFDTMRKKECVDLDYYSCKDMGELCPLSRLCRIDTQKKDFLDLLNGIEQPKIWNETQEHRTLAKEYEDVLEARKGILRLKENVWIYENMCLEESPVFETESAYHKFMEMISFFAKITPLSVPGWIFLQRCNTEEVAPAIIVRNTPKGFGLQQEYIYRILYAIKNDNSILYTLADESNNSYQEKEFCPMQIRYRKKNIFGLEEKLYLLAEDIASHEIVELPLDNGVYVRNGSKYRRNTIKKEEEAEERECVLKIIFLHSPETEYLLNRRDGVWKASIIKEEILKTQVQMRSPYYPERKLWDVDYVSYKVKERDIEGFLEYIDSFGDFAYICERESVTSKRRELVERRSKGKVQECQSLLSVYNSVDLIQKASRPLPPRQIEVQWLKFVLEKYPEFSKLFLETDEIARLNLKLNEKIAGFSWFSKDNFDYECRVKDLNKSVVTKYKKLYQAIQNRSVLVYEYKDRYVRILPYAMEYDFERHLTKDTREPMTVMCYSFDEKRNIQVQYKDIRVNQCINSDEVVFNEYDKLYHVLAAAIRFAVFDKEEIPTKLNNVINLLWKEDLRGGSNYSRCIKKKIRRVGDYCKEYERLQQLQAQFENIILNTFVSETFSYWNSLAASEVDIQPEDAFIWRYQTLLLKCFTDGCKRLVSARVSKYLIQALEAIETNEIMELITGAELSGIPNEIAFYNEKIKNAVVSFDLNDVSEKNIERVYRLFKNYICVGELQKNGKIRFTVTYESFYYRKIHMFLMTLRDCISNISPAIVNEVIRQRIENIDVIKEKL